MVREGLERAGEKILGDDLEGGLAIMLAVGYSVGECDGVEVLFFFFLFFFYFFFFVFFLILGIIVFFTEFFVYFFFFEGFGGFS